MNHLGWLLPIFPSLGRHSGGINLSSLWGCYLLTVVSFRRLITWDNHYSTGKLTPSLSYNQHITFPRLVGLQLKEQRGIPSIQPPTPILYHSHAYQPIVEGLPASVYVTGPLWSGKKIFLRPSWLLCYFSTYFFTSHAILSHTVARISIPILLNPVPNQYSSEFCFALNPLLYPIGKFIITRRTRESYTTQQ